MTERHGEDRGDPRERELRAYRLGIAVAVLLAVVSTSLALAFLVRSVDFEVIPVPSVALPQLGAVEPLPDELTWVQAEFTDLPGWQDDDLLAALPALRSTCGVWEGAGEDREIGGGVLASRWLDWKALCDSVSRGFANRAAMAAELERLLVPVAIGNRGEIEGLFTGYYEASLRGSRRRHDRYQVPLYSRPPELVSVNLGDFRPDLEGRRIGGRLVGNQLKPFADREEISAGALDSRGLEILWVDDPVDAFFLHIQGSGRVELEDGTSVRVGYSDQNGHAYTAIGRELIARGEIPREEMSMQAIRSWLADHDEASAELMNLNASYIFLRELKGGGSSKLTGPNGPIGSMGLPLTPERSLAVDRRFLPLGLPLWLEAEPPRSGLEVLQRLVVAQDTGGAIRGPVRGDLFWGHGERAADLAGPMKSRGRLWALMPVEVLERTLASPADLTDPTDPRDHSIGSEP